MDKATFINKLDQNQLTAVDILEYLNAQGPEVLSLITSPSLGKKIVDQIPYSFSYLKEAFKNENLKELIYKKIEDEDLDELEISDLNLAELFLSNEVFKFKIDETLLKSILTKNITNSSLEYLWVDKVLEFISADHADIIESLISSPKSNLLNKLIKEKISESASLISVLSKEEFCVAVESISDFKIVEKILENANMSFYLEFLKNTQRDKSEFALITYSKLERQGTSQINSSSDWFVICKTLDGNQNLVNLILKEFGNKAHDILSSLNHFDCTLPAFSEHETQPLINSLLVSEEEDVLKFVAKALEGHESKGSKFLHNFLNAFLPSSFSADIKESVVIQTKDLIESQEVFNKYLVNYSHIIDFSKYKNNLTLLLPILVKTKDHMDLFADKIGLLSNAEMSDELFEYFLQKNNSIETYVYIGKHSSIRQELIFDKFRLSSDLFLCLSLFPNISNENLLDALLESVKSRKPFDITSEQFSTIVEVIDFKMFTLEDWIFFSTEIKKKGPKLQINSVVVADKLLKSCPENLKWIFQYKTAKIKTVEDPSLIKAEDVVSINVKDLFFSDNFYKFSPEVLLEIYKGMGTVKYDLDKDPENGYAKFVFLMENFSSDPNDIEHLDKGILRELRNRNLKIQGQTFSYLNCVNSDLLEYALSYVDEKEKVNLLKEYENEVSSDTLMSLSKYYKKILNNFDREFLGSENILIALYKFMPDDVFNYLITIFNTDSFKVLSKIQLSEAHLKQAIIQLDSKFSGIKNMSEFISCIVSNLISQTLSISDLVSIIDNEGLSHKIEEKLSTNYEFEYIQELRKQNKQNLVLNSTKYDLIHDHSWDYYNLHFKNANLSDEEEAAFFTKVEKSLQGPVSTFSSELIKSFKFSKTKDLLKVLKSIDSETFADLLTSLMSSPNRSMMVSVINENLDLLKKLKHETKELTILLVSLYEKGIKSVFKFEYDSLNLRYPSVIEILNDHQDPFLLEKYKKHWKALKTNEFSYLKEIVRELVKGVDKEDVTLENISYYDKKLYFEIAGVQIYKAAFVKKKWITSINLRPDLESLIINTYNNIHEQRPEKIYGAIMINTPEEFIPQDGEFKSHLFNIDESVIDKIIYFRELGGEGFVPAIATRTSDFKYSVEITLQDESSVILSEIEKEISKKTYDINSQIDNLLKMDSKRTFGFELELGVMGDDRKTVADSLRNKGFNVDVSYSGKSSDGGQWDFKEDSSLDKSAVNYGDDNDESGDVFEIASPILCGESGLEEARKFLDGVFLFEVISGEEVSAGLHVHHYIKDLEDLVESSEDLLKTYLPFQETLYSLVKSSRSEGEFCKKIRPDDIKEGRNVYGGHSGVILTNYGTMEFRMKEGTVKIDKIMNWIRYTQQVVLAMEFKIKNNLQKQKDQNDLMAKASMLLLVDFMRSGQNMKEKLKKAKKLVSFQEALYENKL